MCIRRMVADAGDKIAGLFLHTVKLRDDDTLP